MNDDLTTRLSRQLHEQVDDWHTTPLTLDGVRGRARSIRRTRRAVAGGAVAAVLAIAAPVAIIASGGLDAGPDRPVGPATNTPSEAVDSNDPGGSGLGIAYLEGETLTMPDGSQVELPRAYDGVTLLGEQVLATWIDTEDGSVTLDRIEDGEVVGSEDITGLVPNHEGDAVTYVTRPGDIVIEWETGETTIGTVPGARPIRLLGGPDCTLGADDCVVYFEDGQDVRFLNNSGEGGPEEGLAVSDVSVDTHVTVMTSFDDLEPSSCWEVRDWRQPQPVFETCSVSLDRFSPDGAHLSAGPSYRSGIGDSFAAVLDAQTGEELGRVEPANGFIHTTVWENAGQLLVQVHDWDTGSWSVVRLGVDGSTETVLGPVEGGDMDPPWRFAGAP